jgi:hypothetical protein
MKSPWFKYAQILLAAAVVAASIGCGGAYSYTRSHCVSQVATPTGPISVEATADCSASISAVTRDNVSTATYRFGDNRQIVIDGKHILVDGELAHDIPLRTKKITIDVKQGQLSIQADGQPLADASPTSAEQEIQ